MRVQTLSTIRCPRSGSPLQLVDAVVQGGEIVAGKLVSTQGRVYPIEDGTPNFVDAALLTALEASTQADYDRVADGIYDTALDWQFAALYQDEDQVREAMLDLLGPLAGKSVLEVGCGTGRDSFRLARRLGKGGRLHLQDLSPGMVRACRRRLPGLTGAAAECELDYSVSNATELPFNDGVFDAVFHFGGFNQFGDLKKGAAELTRVTKRGGRVVIGDEAVAPWLKGTEFDAIVTTNNALFKAEAPLAALPESARDVEVRWIIGNCFYVIGYTKGEGPPPLNLDLPHRGWRGGTLRSRYFGVLEGVSVEAKAQARQAAAKAGVSVHEWVDRLVKREAELLLGPPKSEP